jgi:hypothetical protein
MCKYNGYIWINFIPKKDKLLMIYTECGTADYENNIFLCDKCYHEMRVKGNPDISTIHERRISK